MPSLSEDLILKKNSLSEFRDLTARILSYIPEVITSKIVKGPYLLMTSINSGTTKRVRPINKQFFISEREDFIREYHEFTVILAAIKSRTHQINNEEKLKIDKVCYTIQQSMGVGMDLLIESNSARKHVGNRFEEFIRAIFNELDITNRRKVIQIPYQTENGQKIYKCENDLILTSNSQVSAQSNIIDNSEVIISVKTTSKDRMGKLFIDKLLLEKFTEQPQKIIAIFLNDVQRKKDNNISYTLVSGLFMVYTKFLTELEGVYYLDPPPNTNLNPLNNHIKRFSELITVDIWSILST